EVSRRNAGAGEFTARTADAQYGVAGARHIFRGAILKTQSSTASETAPLADDVSPGMPAACACGVLHVQRPRFFVCGPIFSKSCGVCALRERISWPATRSVAHGELVRCAGKPGEGDEVLGKDDLIDEQRHERRSGRAELERRRADSLRLHGSRG